MQIKHPKEFMAARNKSVDFYSRQNNPKRSLSYDSRRQESGETDRSTTGRDTTMSDRDSILNGGARRTSTNTNAELTKHISGTEYSSQREYDDKMSKLKTINEVEALRGVFYSFFEMKDVSGRDNAKDKVLISMQVAEASLNPFYNFDEFGLYNASTSKMDDLNYAYSSNPNSIFEHLRRYTSLREQDSAFDAATQLVRESLAGNREIDLDIIAEQEGDESNNLGLDESSEMVNAEEDISVNKPMASKDRRATMMSELTIKTEDDQSSDDQGEDVNPEWVDRVQLRHGMDWLLLIKDEVERDTALANNSLRRTNQTEQTE